MKKTLPANTNLDTPQANPIAEPTGIPSPSTHPFPRKVQKNILLLLPIVVLFIAGIALVLLSQQKTQDMRSRAALTGPTLALSPTTKTVVVGESFTVGATINTNTDTVSAAELHLTYDPAAIQVLSFTPGTVLPVVLSPETHANGSISVTLGASPTSPFKGTDIVGTWTMKMIAAKQPSIQFTSTTAVAALGKPTNALAGTTGSTITVSGTAVTPLSTSHPTLTPVGCSPNGSTCTIPYCPPMPTCPVGRECTQVIPPCSDQDGICQNNQCVPYTSVAPIPTRTPTPRPGCYYKEVQCFMPPCTPILVCPTPTGITIPTRTPTPVESCSPEGSTCIIHCPPIPYCPNGICPSPLIIPSPCSAQNLNPKGICKDNRCVYTSTTPTPIRTPIVTPTVTPRPTPIHRPWWWNWWDGWNRWSRSLPWWRR
jgi:hypothetical protein